MSANKVQVSILANSFLYEARLCAVIFYSRGGYVYSCKIVNVPNILYCSLNAPKSVPAARLMMLPFVYWHVVIQEARQKLMGTPRRPILHQANGYRELP